MSESVPNAGLLKILSVVLALVIALALGNAAWTRYSLSELETAPGVIVEIEARRSSASTNPGAQRVPVAEVALRTGETVRTPLEPSSNSPFCCEVGEPVEVYYDPSDPQRTARANMFGDLYGPQLLFAAVASLFLFAVRKAAG